MKYFGDRADWDSNYFAESDRIPTPVGVLCNWCGESIVEGDAGIMMPLITEIGTLDIYRHKECYLRGVFGSVGHQQRQCSCYGGTIEDPPELTRRESAIAAVDEFWKKSLTY